MSRQEVYLFIHIAAAVIWVGGGALLSIMGTRAMASGDRDRLRGVVNEAADIGNKLFIPAGLVVVAMGLLMVLDGPWDFDLWIVLGLLGFVATMGTGALVLGPRAEKIAHATEAAGGAFTAEAELESRKLLTLARTDVVVLFLVIADMVLKPTGDDVGLLVAMAVILVGGVAFTIAKYRELDEQQPAPPATATA